MKVVLTECFTNSSTGNADWKKKVIFRIVLSTSFYAWNYLRHIVSLGEMITLAILHVVIKSLHLTWGKNSNSDVLFPKEQGPGPWCWLGSDSMLWTVLWCWDPSFIQWVYGENTFTSSSLTSLFYFLTQFIFFSLFKMCFQVPVR